MVVIGCAMNQLLFRHTYSMAMYTTQYILQIWQPKDTVIELLVLYTSTQPLYVRILRIMYVCMYVCMYVSYCTLGEPLAGLSKRFLTHETGPLFLSGIHPRNL